MKKGKFIKSLKKLLKQQGYRKIKIKPAWFTPKATVWARDAKGRRRNLHARLVKRAGGRAIQISEIGDKLEWIDEMELFSVILDED